MPIFHFLKRSFHTGLLLDFVKTDTGTTNDGNTARRFVNDPKFVAETIGLNENLIKRCKVVLIALGTRNKVDP